MYQSPRRLCSALLLRDAPGLRRTLVPGPRRTLAPPVLGSRPKSPQLQAAAASGAARSRPRTEAYPVDILEDDAEGYQAAAEAYYEMLREGAQTSAEVISLSTGEQVRLETSSLCFCTIYRDEPQHKILGLVNPQDTKTVVAVYLKESWWSIEDILRTSDPTREGLMKLPGSQYSASSLQMKM